MTLKGPYILDQGNALGNLIEKGNSMKPLQKMVEEQEIKSFLSSLGFCTAIMAGFAFTGMIELQNWVPQQAKFVGTHWSEIKIVPMWYNLQLKDHLYLFLATSFAAFMTPLLLNMYFLNVTIHTKEEAARLSNVPLVYTVFMGIGIGCSEGALCIFALGTFRTLIAYGICVIMLISLVATSVTIRWFHRHSKQQAPLSGQGQENGEAPASVPTEK